MIRIALVVQLVFVFMSCNRDKDKKIEPVLPRDLILKETSGQVILPAYDTLNMKVANLESLANALVNAPSVSAVSGARTALKEAWVAWTHAGIFEFGPAETGILRMNVNTFPTDTTQINTNINAGNWDFTIASNLDAKGFPALDFLLNSRSEVATANWYFNSPQASAYLQAVVADIKSRTQAVASEWTAGGYVSTFNNSTGTAAGSPISLLVNQMNYDLEITKTNRIAIPLGLKTLGTPLPEKTEAQYGGYSAMLALEQLKGLEAAFHGGQGNGIYEYLVSLKAQYNNRLLADEISDQFVSAKNAMAAVPDPLKASVVNNNKPAVEAAYAEIQKLVVLMKNDMASAMGIMITYQDNDGD